MSNQSRRVGRDRVQSMVRDDEALLVEVLSRPAFEALHLPDAINIPLRELDPETVEGIDPSRPIIVYCYDYQ